MDALRDYDREMSEVFGGGLEQLRGFFGAGWSVEPIPDHDSRLGNRYADRMIVIRSKEGDGQARFVVDLETAVTPKIVEQVLRSKLNLVRHVNSFTSLMVMSPWISPQTQALLRDRGISYLDLTGNAWIRTDRPAIFIRTQGQSRAPRGTSKPATPATLSGSKAERLVRTLADVKPPYRATDLAEATGLSLPYVSRLLSTLEDQLLIQRDGRTIHTVDWQGILKARAEQSNLLHQNPYRGFLAPNGTDYFLDQLHDAFITKHGIAITGAYAARQVAPLSAGGQLMIYIRPSHDMDTFADACGLLPVSEGSDVLMMEAHDPVVFHGARDVGGLPHVALSQLVLDCLSGPGRLPAEGEAVLDYMASHEEQWRAFNIHSISNWRAS